MNEINQYQQSQPSRGAAMSEAITGIFQTLRAYYPKCNLVMRTEKQELDMMREWGKALMTAKVTEVMIKNGIERAKSYAAEDSFCNWPSLVNFISWCHGIPSPESAYFETSKKSHDIHAWEPSHPIVALAGRSVGFKDIWGNDGNKNIKTEYIKKYTELLTRVLAGEKFKYEKPEKPLGIPKHEPTEEDLARNKRMLSVLASMVREDQQEKKPQPKPMTEEEKNNRLEKIRKQAEEWNKSRGDK